MGKIGPALSVVVEGPNGLRLPLTTLLDTGADCSCFPTDFAGQFGIDLKDCVPVPGGSSAGETEYLRWEDGYLTCEVLGQSLKLEPLFGDLEDPVLGREDFFMRFTVRFREREGLMDIEPCSA
jgi:hypothetical protein